MPYVTDELYDKLPIHEETIILSSYPKFNDKEIYNDEYNKINNIIEFIKVFRNIKLENKITSNFKVKINNNEDYSLIFTILKIDKSKLEDIQGQKYSCIAGIYNLDIYYEKEISEDDILLKEKQIKSLVASIERRKALLSNENYLSKAPEQLVENERKTLQEEQMKLKMLKEDK